ncbi:glycosyltransferase [Chitinimonas lacunae]|uniref:Glycosyltransferase n=1 Tax=Chitinimonas lacunae TaxID=1963018 RepID=A0ABV8MXR2_9NEIS
MSHPSTPATVSLQQAFAIALKHHQAGQLNEAEHLYRQILQAAPQHADARHLLGVIAYQAGQPRAAVELIRQALAIAPDTPDYYVNLGEALRSSGDAEAALDAYRSALHHQPEHVGAWCNLGIALLALGRHRESIEASAQALELRPDHLNARANLAAALQQSGHYRDAVRHYRAALQQAPDHLMLRLNLAHSLLAAEDYAAALAAYGELVGQVEPPSVLDEGRAQALAGLGRHGEQLSWQASLTPAQRTSPIMRLCWAKARFGLGEREEALRQLRELLREAPGLAQLHQTAGQWCASLAAELEPPPADHGRASGRAPSISVVICSITPSKLAAVSQQFAEHFSHLDYELIAIDDATSLAEGYQRGWRRSHGDIVIFSHDDIELIGPGFADRLLAHLERHDLVGVAGSSRLIDASWRASGFPYLHGLVGHRLPDEDGIVTCLYGVSDVATAAEALDGVFLAARRHVFDRVDFDPVTFDGFHGYDVDFSFAARLAGCRVAVAADLPLIHHSAGRYTEDWQRYAERFRAKYAAELSARREGVTPNDFLVKPRLDSAESLARLSGWLRHLYHRGLTEPSRDGYGLWLACHQDHSATTLAAQTVTAAGWSRRPRFLLALLVRDESATALARSIDSLQRQSYRDWTLLLAHDPALETGPAPGDSRLRWLPWDQLDAALAQTDADWFSQLDNGDALAPDALFQLAQALQTRPETAFIYTDQDRLDRDGQRSEPYCKPEWDLDLFVGNRLPPRLAALPLAAARTLGGAADWFDLCLRHVETLPTGRIHHLPQLLYHASAHETVAPLAAVTDHLVREGAGAVAEAIAEAPGAVRVRYPLPQRPPLVSILIPTRNRLELLRSCIDSLRITRYPYYEVLVIDNGSDDPACLDYLAQLARRPNFRVLRDESPFNFSALNNQAARAARGEVLCLLNNDIEAISPDWLAEMVSQALRPGVGAVGARLWFDNDTLEHAGVILVGGVAGHAHRHLPRGHAGHGGRALALQRFSAVTAACLVVRRDRYEEVGGLDEGLAVAFNDVDFCLKLDRAGYRNLWTPHAELYHHESLSRGYEDNPEKRARFDAEIAQMQARWGETLLSDPAYNPNLTFVREDFGLAWPPRHPAA